MSRKPINRRAFIKVSSAGVASLLIGCRENSRFKDLPPDTLNKSNEPHSSGRSSEENPVQNTQAAQCAATSDDITGPYWRDGIPVRNEFDLYGHPGQKLRLSGTVRDERCEPIANAVIEMWHAAPTEVSASALSPADSVGYDTKSPRFRYYGQFATDAQGAYAVTTLKPGWYLNGADFRPSHIHVRIYINGTERLTTQLYFKDDPFIERDPWASAAPKRALALSPAENNSLAGTFDFTV